VINDLIERKGVEPYDGSVRLIHQLRREGFKIAVVTSSQNCTTVLKAAKLDDFFKVRVDGNIIEAERLAGKPAPDTFLMAASLLSRAGTDGCDRGRHFWGGSNGHFGLVIGVARKGNVEEVKRHGAHVVVDDLGKLVN
jgi:phosphoglycolate phosphatase-like HAD superfamily hydrolase